MGAKIRMPMNYLEARVLLAGKARRKIGHNTWLELRPADNQIDIVYHETSIVQLFESSRNAWRVTSGGYRTSTTKERIAAFLWFHGLSLWQVKGEWKISVTGDRKNPLAYFDGLSSDVGRMLKRDWMERRLIEAPGACLEARA